MGVEEDRRAASMVLGPKVCDKGAAEGALLACFFLPCSFVVRDQSRQGGGAALKEWAGAVSPRVSFGALWRRGTYM